MRASTLPLSLLALLASGCAETEGVVLSLQGRVQAFDEQLGLPDARVAVWAGDTLLGESESDATGAFAVTVAAPYHDDLAIRAEVSHPDYVTTDIHQTVRLADPDAAALVVVPGRVLDATVIYLPGIYMAPISDQDGMVGGKVFDALYADQGLGIGGLDLAFREGIGAPSDGAVIATARTTGSGPNDADGVGAYRVEALPAGTYTAFIDGGDDYLDAKFTVVSVGGAQTLEQNGATTPVLDDDEFRVVLTWGEAPADLDAHLTGPDDSDERLHVFYASPSHPEGTTTDSAVVFLDVDDTSSFGPETVTVRRTDAGRYRYSVHDYTNRESTSSEAISYSRASVQLFVGRDHFESFDVPSGYGGTVWTVFELDGETGLPYLANTFTYEADPNSSTAF